VEARFVTSEVLAAAGFRHAFFTRHGGVSTGPYSSLNFSIAVGDEPENVAENLRRAARAVGVSPERIYYLSQVHGAAAQIVSGTEPREDVLATEGDALVGDESSGSVVAIHAGWKGLVAGVLEAGIGTLRGVIGRPGSLVAAIGPHITALGFEVSEDVATVLAGCSSRASVVERHPGGKPHVNLAAIARDKLLSLGLPEPNIEVVPGCTHTDRERFFSFRRDGRTSGRHLSLIVPRRRV
jgi:copper oxidase (laccase) domain-containing protein